ncbi:glycosyltransferase [Parablautia sp. Marseille-Q6255]|uniref:glycosyltransferase n=1 Tax=Parablautia sp. Marseille-Q6255 TaxID=3039593 RepID=UPI0024BCC726|nr:glycosyltransferase [Parablautia sp. Marseille-Q6255]
MEKKNNYVILPKISNQKLLAQYYSMADAFVICSKRENFPTTCLEAQCCGTPVFGFDTGGTKETSLSSTNEFVEYGDIDSLYETAKRVLNENNEDLDLRAHEKYSRKQMFCDYLKEYDRTGRKEKVLLIDVNCKYSSTGKIVYDLYENIRADGRSAAICYGRGKQIKEPDIFKFGLDWETNIHAVLARVTGYNACFSHFSTQRLIRFIEEYKPDLIHIHELHAYFVNIKPLIHYIKKKGIPVVWTFHCEYMYTGKCGHANECKNFQTECHNCPALREYPKSLFFDHTRKMFREKKKLLGDLDMTIVAPSKWIADRVKLSFLKNKTIQIINNGIDTDIFHKIDGSELRKQLGIPEENQVVLSVAPNIMSESKGGNWVIKLAEKMQKEKVSFVLIGDTTE